MGWAGGSVLFDVVIATMKKHVGDPDKRKAMYIELIDAFESEDWDTENECLGQDDAYDAALCELHPDLYGDEEE